MVDAIIVVIVFILLLFALRSSVKRFKGEKTCCSGGNVKNADKHLDGPVIGSYKVRISGMHCDNCAKRIKQSVDSIDGAVADVDWKEGSAVVRYDRSIDESVLRDKIQILGYKVESISVKSTTFRAP